LVALCVSCKENLKQGELVINNIRGNDKILYSKKELATEELRNKFALLLKNHNYKQLELTQETLIPHKPNHLISLSGAQSIVCQIETFLAPS
jgi:hypothetical protein